MSYNQQVCGNCGSDQIQGKAWVPLNDDQIKPENVDFSLLENEDEDDYWCPACEGHHRPKDLIADVPPTEPTPAKITVETDWIAIHDGENEIVSWHSDEWKEDPELVVPAIANAIHLAYTDFAELKRLLGK